MQGMTFGIDNALYIDKHHQQIDNLMNINANNPPVAYNSITNPENPTAKYHRDNGQNLPRKESVSTSNQARILAELDIIEEHQKT